MKLINIRSRGRRLNPATGRPVNVYVERKSGRSVDITYYLYLGKRVIIQDNELQFWAEVKENLQ